MLAKAKHRPTALIVDDDRAVREMYSSYLAAKGINTVEAEDGLHAVAKATSILPDVITTDIRLPVVNGIQLCRSLKRGELTRHIPVIAILGSASQNEVAAAKKAGCVSVLMKPCLPETLLNEIWRVLLL